jgi:hypothetical protein
MPKLIDEYKVVVLSGNGVSTVCGMLILWDVNEVRSGYLNRSGLYE